MSQTNFWTQKENLSGGDISWVVLNSKQLLLAPLRSIRECTKLHLRFSIIVTQINEARLLRNG